MKVIFLDFDGVINNYEEEPINMKCLLILKEIIKVTGAKVVVTSSNKYSFQDYGKPYFESNCYNNYVKKLNDEGIYIYDFTPSIGHNREKEIQVYLELHPEINEFLILDDDYFFDRWNGHQIYVDLDCGITCDDIKTSIDILNGNLFYYDVTSVERDNAKRLCRSNELYRQFLNSSKI